LSEAKGDASFCRIRYAVGSEDHAATGGEKEARMEDSTGAVAMQAFIAQAVTQFRATVEALGAWAMSTPRSLAELEGRTLGDVRDVGQRLLAGVCGVVAASTVAGEATPCPCGQQARYQRQRVAQVKTVLGPITIRRGYYHCVACQHGLSPLDRQLGYCAGSTSAGLAELLALLGATADSFEAASTLLGCVDENW
jgi:hypothetical protein